jgi:hypothetical protein
MFEKRALRVTFVGTASDQSQEKMLNELKVVAGVKNVSPDIGPDNNLRGVTIQGDRDIALSTILAVIVNSGLMIGEVNSEEPTLEDVFMHLTRPTE